MGGGTVQTEKERCATDKAFGVAGAVQRCLFRAGVADAGERRAGGTPPVP